MSRGFTWIKEYAEDGKDRSLPQRKTLSSAGYDIAVATTTHIPAGKTVLVPTGLKAWMESDEVLLLTIRSSKAVQKHLMLSNAVGVIDADYFDNSKNEGHIMLAVTNFGAVEQVILQGEEIAQGIFVHYLRADHDFHGDKRQGGFGSTDHKE